MFKALQERGKLLHPDGASFGRPERMAMFFKPIREGDAEQLGRQLHRHRVADILFHRRRHHHTDQAEHSERLDAALDDGIRHP